MWLIRYETMSMGRMREAEELSRIALGKKSNQDRQAHGCRPRHGLDEVQPWTMRVMERQENVSKGSFITSLIPESSSTSIVCASLTVCVSGFHSSSHLTLRSRQAHLTSS